MKKNNLILKIAIPYLEKRCSGNYFSEFLFDDIHLIDQLKYNILYNLNNQIIH